MSPSLRYRLLQAQQKAKNWALRAGRKGRASAANIQDEKVNHHATGTMSEDAPALDNITRLTNQYNLQESRVHRGTAPCLPHNSEEG